MPYTGTVSEVKPYRDVQRVLITREEDIPDFSQMSPQDEADWWDAHELADHLMEGGSEVEAEIFEALGISKPTQ